MEEYRIEKGIPIPPRFHSNGGMGRTSKYPFSKMEIGDSILCDNSDYPRVKSFLASAIEYGRRTKMKFLHRNTPGGFRVWRTE